MDPERYRPSVGAGHPEFREIVEFILLEAGVMASKQRRFKWTRPLRVAHEDSLVGVVLAGFDSLGFLDLVMEVEDEYEITVDQGLLAEIRSVGQFHEKLFLPETAG